MSVHLYPVPGVESGVEKTVEPFLESEVSEEGLSPNSQFLILVFGESASDSVPEIREFIRDYSSTAEQALEIEQLGVESIDERRLNTFTTSLLFNLLEVDSDGRLEDILQSDVITDEDERKIDYYLPRVIDSVSEKVSKQQDSFEAKLRNIFPVELETQAAREMHERLEMDIVTDQTIMDYLLLASSSTEDQSGIRTLIEYLRENDIDESGYLSGGSENVSGYKRVISLSYSLVNDDFTDEFQTARNLYKNGATGELFRILNEVDTEIELGNVYNHESSIERLLTSQFAGNDREIAERLLRTINGTRAVENNRDKIEEQFTASKEELEETIDQTQTEIEKLEDHNDRFEEAKIVVDTDEIDQFVTLIKKVEEIDSTIAKYLLGFEREQRTSMFTTLETRIDNYRQELQSYRNRIDDFTEAVDGFERKKEANLKTIEEVYSEINGTSIQVELPSQKAVKNDLETRWDERVNELETSLPVINLDVSEEEVEEILDAWETAIDEADDDLDEIETSVERLEEFNSNLQDIEKQREKIRATLEDVQQLMEGEV